MPDTPDKFAVVRQMSSITGAANVEGWFSNAAMAEAAFTRQCERHPDQTITLVKLVKQSKPRRDFAHGRTPRRPSDSAMAALEMDLP
jgi:hypothetical protein